MSGDHAQRRPVRLLEAALPARTLVGAPAVVPPRNSSSFQKPDNKYLQYDEDYEPYVYDDTALHHDMTHEPEYEGQYNDLDIDSNEVYVSEDGRYYCTAYDETGNAVPYYLTQDDLDAAGIDTEWQYDSPGRKGQYRHSSYHCRACLIFFLIDQNNLDRPLLPRPPDPPYNEIAQSQMCSRTASMGPDKYSILQHNSTKTNSMRWMRIWTGMQSI